ncbi:ATP-dependent helicase [Flavobacterium sp. NPDC079362]|uniref:ATP-dependent helicase n=1 Tax=Flavobacterium sp. NPDC079362 TaxID=3390566 RepID=UPI003CFF9D75
MVHFHGKNDFEESLWVASEIKQILKTEKANYSDITILYRANHISRNIEQSLIKENILYTIFGGVKFFERKEIKDVLSLLRLIVTGDNISFLRMFNHPSRGLGKKFIERLSYLGREQNLSLLSALEQNIADKELAKKGAAEFLDLIAELKEIAKTKSISDLVKEILERSGLAELYRKDGDEDRLENIKELVSSMLLLEKENKEPVNVEEYLQEIALYTDLDTHNENQDKVKLMTIHISKGLEFPYVFLCGFTEGVLPSALSIKERRSRAIEEERRLTYVAVTRAEKRFYITDSEGYNFTTGLNKYPSRFLFEISEEFYIRKGKLSPEILQAYKVPSRNSDTESKELFAVGDLVFHEVFKKGRIKALNLDKNQYTIDFFEIGKEKPIDFNFRFMKRITDDSILESNEADNTNSAIDLQTHLKSQKNPFEKDFNESSAEESLEDQQFGKDEKAVPGENLSSGIATDIAKNKNKKWWKF